MEEESPLHKKKIEYQKSIRKEQLESIFKSKRAEIVEAASKNLLNLTAGKKFAQKQKEIFTKQNFLKVFSKDELENLKIDFQVFKKEDEFDAPNRRQAIRKLEKFMLLLSQTRNDEKFNELDINILKLKRQENFAHRLRIDEIAINYFKKIYHGCKIVIGQKNDGIHLGNKIQIYSSQTEKEKPIIYHVKTHSNGLIVEKSSAAKILNPLELMIYKILEKIGIGCESHFFCRDIRNFYIATKDAGSDYPYFSYGLIKDNLEDFEFVNTKDFQNGIFCLDLLSRILRLTDLHANPGNFGFVQSPDGWRVRAIDFRPPQIDQDNKIDQTYFRGFLKGITHVSYKDKIIKGLFEKEKGRLEKLAEEIFLDQFKQFLNILEDCKQDILQKIEKHEMELQEQVYEEMRKNLISYTNAIKYNFDLFCEKLKISL